MDQGQSSPEPADNLPPGGSAFPNDLADLAKLQAAARSDGVPFWAVTLIATAALVGGGAFGALVLGGIGSGGPGKSGGVEQTPATTATAAPAAAPQPEEKDPLQLVAEGDEAAVKKLEEKPVNQRTLAEGIALAQARVAAKRFQISEIARKTELVPAYGVHRDTLGKIVNHAKDREVAVDLLEMLGGLPGQVGPDHIYKLSNNWRVPKETRRLAEELVFAKEVRSKASPALAVVLDLKEITGAQEKDCAAASKVLERAQADGDQRIFSPMKSVRGKRGCGERKLDDCWDCLRKPDLVKATIREVRGRKAPF